MAEVPIANGNIGKVENPPLLAENKPPRPKKKGQRLAEIHSKPLPLEVHPLPTFQPSNPLSLLQLCYTWISDVLFPPASHPSHSYVGYFSPETRAVHVTDPRCARVLWQMGFFGKGTLSRSEPSWLEREEARIRKERSEATGKLAAEDRTHARREERRLFKLERARLEHERVLRQRLIEEGKLDPDSVPMADISPEEVGDANPASEETGDLVASRLEYEAMEMVEAKRLLGNGNLNGSPKPPLNVQLENLNISSESPLSPLSTRHIPPDTPYHPPEDSESEIPDRGRQPIQNEEYLQLTFEEAFFLTYALGVLDVHPTKRRDPSPLSTKQTAQPYATEDLLELFCQHSSFPPSDAVWITPDDQFLLNYVAYHHFRSLGWVVRPGQKFAVDYLLYNRGPVFSHAEFAVIVVPAYTDRYWNTPGGRARRRVWEEKDWWWLHGVNRVQSRVFKTLVLCYIDIPSELDLDFDDVLDIGKLLRSYKVREFVVRRWLPNRSR